MPTSSDGRFGHARGFGHRARAPVSKSVGFSRCPQAPSAFIKLIVQGAIFGSHYLDCLIILHAQNLSDQTSAVNKNDRLFIYTSYVTILVYINTRCRLIMDKPGEGDTRLEQGALHHDIQIGRDDQLLRLATYAPLTACRQQAEQLGKLLVCRRDPSGALHDKLNDLVLKISLTRFDGIVGSCDVDRGRRCV